MFSNGGKEGGGEHATSRCSSPPCMAIPFTYQILASTSSGRPDLMRMEHAVAAKKNRTVVNYKKIP